MTPERREEVRQLLHAAARHLAAKERGEDSHLGFGFLRPLDEGGNVIRDDKVISSWRAIGPMQITFSLRDVDPDVIRILTGEE